MCVCVCVCGQRKRYRAHHCGASLVHVPGRCCSTEIKTNERRNQSPDDIADLAREHNSGPMGLLYHHPSPELIPAREESGVTSSMESFDLTKEFMSEFPSASDVQEGTGAPTKSPCGCCSLPLCLGPTKMPLVAMLCRQAVHENRNRSQHEGMLATFKFPRTLSDNDCLTRKTEGRFVGGADFFVVLH